MKKTSFFYNVLWSKSHFGLAVNERYAKKDSLPLTTYYYWPREDGWNLLKTDLDSRPWIADTTKSKILKDYNTLIHFWIQNLNKPTTKQSLEHHGLDLDLCFLALPYTF